MAAVAVPQALGAEPTRHEAAQEDIIVGAWADPAQCNRGNSQKVAIKELVAAGHDFIGRCVAVTGFWSGRAVFDDYKSAVEPRSNSTARTEAHRVGLYARERVLQSAPRHPAPFTIVGVAGRCEAEWPNAIMVLGYCHNTSGPIVRVSETYAATAKDVR
jgi:hypothetical protein